MRYKDCNTEDYIIYSIIAIVVLVSILAIIFTIYDAFRGPNITEGNAIEKEFLPAERKIIMTPIRISNGKTSTTMFIPHFFDYPDRWSIKISAHQNNKVKTEIFWVSKELFDSTKIDDFLSFNESVGSIHEPRGKGTKVE